MNSNQTQYTKGENMNRIVGLACLVGGVVLAIFGANATNSFGSQVSKFFTGSPTDKAIWMLIGGIALAIVGLVLAAGRRTSS
jgi:hypothetical protein